MNCGLMKPQLLFFFSVMFPRGRRVNPSHMCMRLGHHRSHYHTRSSTVMAIINVRKVLDLNGDWLQLLCQVLRNYQKCKIHFMFPKINTALQGLNKWDQWFPVLLNGCLRPGLVGQHKMRKITRSHKGSLSLPHWYYISTPTLPASGTERLLGFHSLKPYNLLILWYLEAMGLDIEMIISLWNLTGASAALLLKHLSNFRAIGKPLMLISQLWDFRRSAWWKDLLPFSVFTPGLGRRPASKHLMQHCIQHKRGKIVCS